MDTSHENREQVSRAHLPRVFSRFTAWLLWAGIHIYSLIGFANRLLVTLQWAISFVTKRRGVRILPLAQAEITQADPGRQSGPRTPDEE